MYLFKVKSSASSTKALHYRTTKPTWNACVGLYNANNYVIIKSLVCLNHATKAPRHWHYTEWPISFMLRPAAPRL